MGRRKVVNEAFTSSLFLESAKTIKLSDRIDDEYYQIGDLVKVNGTEYCIISITDEDVTLEDINFPLDFEEISIQEFLKTQDGTKKFLNFTNQPTVDDSYVDCEYEENGRRYKVVSVTENNVTVEDLTMLELLGFSPRQTIEIDKVYNRLLFAVKGTSTANKKAQVTAVDEVQNDNKSSVSTDNCTGTDDSIEFVFSLFGNDKKSSSNTEFKIEEVSQKKCDFVITSESYRTVSERIFDNLEAIEVLRTLSNDNRNATSDEQSVLNKYSGWGGLNAAFDENSKHYQPVLEALRPQEYTNARESLLNAFYTPKNIIECIYIALEKYGFKGGRVLEPSMGTGRFFGCMPEKMRNNCTLYGVELDELSASISKQLYQSAKIFNQGFEKTNFGDDIFDLAISNVPFGDYGVSDSKYNNLHLNIHDYFICKMIDSVRPGGLVVAITTVGTMDKQSNTARKYIAERAELVGAIRLPDSTFRNAHTKPVTDLLLFQKRDEKVSDVDALDWLACGYNPVIDGENAFEERINSYYIANSECIVGNEKIISGPFGNRVTVDGDVDADRITEILTSFNCVYTEYFSDCSNDTDTIPLPNELFDSPNFSYVNYKNNLYFRENGVLTIVTPNSKKQDERIRKMIVLRDSLLNVLSVQIESDDDTALKKAQSELNSLYDTFVLNYGRISSKANSLAFREDSKYPLMCALEIYDDDNNFLGKADVFSKRTIALKSNPVAENESDALDISIAEKGYLDFAYMSMLTGKTKEQLIEKLCLENKLFKLPYQDGYATSDDYLSGYVKEKLRLAKQATEEDPTFKANVLALEGVQPKDIPYNEIFAPLGATWIDIKYYEEFMYQLFDVPAYCKDSLKITLVNDKFYITLKNSFRSVKTNSTYGTEYMSGLELYEDCLNLISSKVYDYYEENGKIKCKVNDEKTQVVQTKQEGIRQCFNDWLWDDYERRTALEKKYNDTMNILVERKYDGSKIRFVGMNTNIELMPHQKNGVARNVRAGNTLYAHVVGAGKTFTMIAAAMEKKRLGLCNKPLFVVPNHLVMQWASEFGRLYPCANILITGKKDFQKENRKKFCSRIATGNYDAVIMSHSQFLRIPLSKERQEYEICQQIDEIENLIDSCNEIENYQVKKYTIAQQELAKKRLIKKLDDLSNMEKDNAVTFEELGVDALYLDEAHLFKNLSVFTKLKNVAGLTNANSQKAFDLYMKVNYLNDITDYRGVVFATGTPISNAVCELYVMQKYLQNRELERHGIYSFDSWISRFAETETKIEVKPEGTGYRAVTRVSRYHNLPELMTIFRMVADIKMADQINLDVPDCKNHNVAVNPSETQKCIVESFAERAESIRCGFIDKQDDNMLCVTNDGRKLAIDARLYNINIEDDKKSKLNRMIRTVFKIWKLTAKGKGTQIVFSDMGTPNKKSDYFDVYNEVKSKLISYGVPEDEIAFIHDANTDTKKLALFDKVNKGIVRVILGSTEKLGAGTNIQKRLIAIHNLDCPWRPSDLEQRLGRMVRQGNLNKLVHCYSYVTKNTFDTYLYQTVLAKAKFISQIMSSKNVQRDADDIDTACLNYAEIKALSTGNPAIKEKMELEEKVAKLKILRSNYTAQKYDLEKEVKIELPNKIFGLEAKIFAIKQDIDLVSKYPLDEEHKFSPMTICGSVYTEKRAAADKFQSVLDTVKTSEQKEVGKYRGLNMYVYYDPINNNIMLTFISSVSGYSYPLVLGYDGMGNIQRINNLISDFKKGLEKFENELSTTKAELERGKEELLKPFDREDEYKECVERLRALDKQLSVQGANGIENIVA